MAKYKKDITQTVTHYFDDYTEFVVNFEKDYVVVDLSGIKDGEIRFLLKEGFRKEAVDKYQKLVDTLKT